MTSINISLTMVIISQLKTICARHTPYPRVKTINFSNISHYTLFPDPDERVVKPAPDPQLEVSIAFLLLIVNNVGNVLNDMSTGNSVAVALSKQ